jgi:hypothetical protein
MYKLKNWKQYLATGFIAIAGIQTSFAQGDDTRALVDTLVKKGLLTNQEAADVVAKNRKDVLANSGYQIKVGSWIKELKLVGDARLRYEYREGQSTAFTSPTAINPSATAFSTTSNGDTLARERWRYRLRFGAEATFTDEFKGGLRLETSSNPRSTNITFGDETAGNGPFGKTSDGIFVGLAYLEWHPVEWATLIGGKMNNPLMTSLMVWDGDINPEGAAQKFTYKLNDDLELFANLGQFIYDDKSTDEPLASAGAVTGGNDSWIFAQQFGARYSINKDTSIALAPIVYAYSGPGDTFTGRFDGTGAAAGAAQDIAINDLLIVEIPMEFKFQLMDTKMKLFSDVAVNARGEERARHAGRTDQDGNNLAYQAGLTFGEAKGKGGWEAQAYWMHKELYALDPNLTDSDLFDSKLNLEGVVFGIKYNFTDFLTGSITYAMADRINHNLPTTFTGDIAVNPLSDYRILQCDLLWKF